MTPQSATRGQGGAAEKAKIVVSRFAPSPTGRLHLGHAFSALQAHDFARERGGRFLLRIEDIDPGRCREEFVEGILEDLSWLGLTWDGDVIRQSHRLPFYAEALDHLKAQNLVYPCFCTRSTIAAEIAASASAPHGPDGPHYPGTCRGLSAEERNARMRTEPHAWRLDMVKAIDAAQRSSPSVLGEGDRAQRGGGAFYEGDGPIPDGFTRRREDAKRSAAHPQSPLVSGLPDTSFASSRLRVQQKGASPALTWTNDGVEVEAHPDQFGDVVLARKDAPTSYHLAVTLDDAAQGVTDVVRGADLYASTHIHRLLQALLGLPIPAYHHHPLLTDAEGMRLAKRTNAPTLADLCADGADPRQLIENLRRGILPAEIRLATA
jgi:glutamyl-Q tRNA(Asp) synthetase